MGPMQMDFSDVPAPVAMRFDVPMTDEELIAFSILNKPWRFEREKNGEITVMTPVGGTGSLHEMTVSSALHAWNRKARTGMVFAPNAGFNLPDGSCLAPDAAWLKMDRWVPLTRQEKEGFPPVCPEFVVEVRSQSDPRRPLEEKMLRWIENGAQLAWLIDPFEKQVVVYRPGEATETLEAPDVVRGHAPVDGFELEMQPIWEV
jgi:Uma2 family endonuclease